ncbi:hypothetical protein BDF20DRAFT_185401 [Mycotypha africana]|uniref:uncharacterized protein n=1 Tax=Mycotypha africana TaxID=64632 RepID=UPI0023019A08|nr:uncharacterized protein BDF20DRAFT_185401 [Mycotypha africana]KAI8968502.1 hypothetical protein BDF20DRAFT_185401 [Mycotypha africana]
MGTVIFLLVASDSRLDCILIDTELLNMEELKPSRKQSNHKRHLLYTFRADAQLCPVYSTISTHLNYLLASQCISTRQLSYPRLSVKFNILYITPP